ncbi:tripartite tricarboxylate transporter permease, partial [Zwartia vadi]|uniref:tripartite tricarboxylate transporter permease n=1 Tax=Zwartia vadi TaxID=3058168 RepID=UPI0028C2A58A|nr:tripartite tricarboxylate transporter permease [Zwartia vadi]
IGVYSLNYNVFDIIVTAIFGIVGYLWSKLKCEGAPLLLGLVLGPLMEENFRRALLLSRGNFMTFLERPLSASLLGVALLLVLII